MDPLSSYQRILHAASSVHLTVLTPEAEVGIKQPLRLRCRCGVEFQIKRAGQILYGGSKSCGCLRKQFASVNGGKNKGKTSVTYQKVVSFAALQRLEVLTPESEWKLKGPLLLKCHCGSEYSIKRSQNILYSRSNCGCVRSATTNKAVSRRLTYKVAIELLSKFKMSFATLPDDLSAGVRRLYTAGENLLVCHCGNVFGETTSLNDVLRGFVKSCGCVKSFVERDLYTWVKEVAPDAVKNTRKIIKPLEIDIYIPSKKLGIEVDGLYWHGEKKYGTKARTKMLCKYEAMIAAGVRPLFFFEDEVKTREAAVLGYVQSLLGIKQTVGARQCQIVDGGKDFVAGYHIQGADKNRSTKYLSLVCNNEIVATAGFLVCTGQKSVGSGSYELTRYCVGPGLSVAGGLSKLIKEWARRSGAKTIITYADLRLSQGGIYKACGFKEDRYSPPGYHYFKGDTRYHRFGFRKSELEKKGWLKPGQTEWECMQEQGFDRVYDCGKVKWVLHLP